MKDRDELSRTIEALRERFSQSSPAIPRITRDEAWAHASSGPGMR